MVWVLGYIFDGIAAWGEVGLRSSRIAEGDGEEHCTRLLCNQCYLKACQMLEASRMELDIVFDSRCGGLFSFSLCLEFPGGGRWWY
jgi:hypothetical protein